QREGPDKEAQEAKKLLGKLEAQMKKAAEAHYEKGRVFFAKEQVDKAIAEWEQAAKLAPDNQEYAESLRRARLLKERLELLRQAASEPAPAGEEEAVGAGQ
ncbi:MAG: tetratricopeptide repeat protein, partial [Zetaproteobacteria bacterium]